MFVLTKNNGKVYAKRSEMPHQSNMLTDGEHKEIPVTLAWLRPISGVGQEITLISEESEVGIIENLEMMDSASRKIAEEELEKNYFVAVIKKIVNANVYLGNRYFDVLTDKGKSSFIVKNPFVAIRKYGVDGLFIRDTAGNMFVIESVAEMDEKSRREMEKVI